MKNLKSIKVDLKGSVCRLTTFDNSYFPELTHIRYKIAMHKNQEFKIQFPKYQLLKYPASEKFNHIRFESSSKNFVLDEKELWNNLNMKYLPKAIFSMSTFEFNLEFK